MKQADRGGGVGSAALIAAAGGLTIERIVAVDSPREVRLHPRDRLAAFKAEAGGARQLFTISLRTGARTQVSGSEKDISDPQWSPDGRRLTYVRGEEIRIVDLDGGRDVLVAGHPAGVSLPRWSPDGQRMAFVSRRRGWSQAWLVNAPVPRRGRPAKDPRPPEPRAITATGFDVEDLEWSADGASLAVVTFREPDHAVAEIHLVDVATGAERRGARGGEERGGRGFPPPSHHGAGFASTERVRRSGYAR